MNSNEVLTVSALTRAIKFNLESKFTQVTLQGEISNFKLQTSGHLYFNIKDPEAQIGAVMFRMEAATLKRMPKEGDQVIVKGSINVYPQQGKYQIVIKELEFAGLGALLLKLEELKQKLHKLGFFRSDRKKPLPPFPKVIGVVTSPTGAVIQDILNVLNRRQQNFKLILNPVKVQGEGAAQEISQAIRAMNQYQLCDVMIIGRGGGSIEDLWAFNEEIVAQAIYESKIPIIAAIGHETDHTIACYVADIRAPTPSAAAEIVVKESKSYLDQLTQMDSRLKTALLHHLKHEKQKLLGILRSPLFQRSSALLGPSMQKLDDLKESLELSIKNKIDVYKNKVERFSRIIQALNPLVKINHNKIRIKEKAYRLDQLMAFKLKNEKHKLHRIEELLKAIDPKNILNKGYSILFSEKDRSVIKSIHSIQKHDRIEFLVSDGSGRLEVLETKTNGK
jgi:exodeoxyribonuclease VII large subunit